MDDDLDWDELMAFVRDGRVVPVVGNHLLRVTVDGRATTVEAELARQLAGELRVAGPNDGELRLSEVAFRHLQARGKVMRLYPRLTVLLERCQFEIPEALRQLAEIRAFPLFLTTSFTPLLATALDRARFAGRAETEVLAFTTYSQPGDLRSPALGTGSCVYHLFGRASSMPDYVVTEEDLIEFMHGLQSHRRPQNLFDYLRGRHLLFLGCGYANWLARFFIRTLRNERFASANSQRSEVIVDEVVAGDTELAVFLRQYDSHVFRSPDATEFVAQLHQRWSADARAPASRPSPPLRPMSADAVFLSYAREDIAHARAIRDALDAAGIDVWFDEQRLDGGVDWERVIQDNIRRCSLFVPLISRSTEARQESFFRVEWDLALRRAQRMAGSTRKFIIPVSVDGTSSAAPNVPDEFRKLHWIYLLDPGGADGPINEIRSIVRSLRAPQYPPQEPPGQQPGPPGPAPEGL
jgi:TIR domain-containing protein/SIR2-like protein